MSTPNLNVSVSEFDAFMRPAEDGDSPRFARSQSRADEAEAVTVEVPAKRQGRKNRKGIIITIIAVVVIMAALLVKGWRDEAKANDARDANPEIAQIIAKASIPLESPGDVGGSAAAEPGTEPLATAVPNVASASTPAAAVTGPAAEATDAAGVAPVPTAVVAPEQTAAPATERRIVAVLKDGVVVEGVDGQRVLRVGEAL